VTGPVTAAPPAPPLKPRAQRARPESDADAIARFAMEITKRVGKLSTERGDAAYPRLARDRRWEGTTKVRVEFTPGGKVKLIAMNNSSSYAVLDQRALEMVKEVMEDPKVPGELRDRAFVVHLPIVFKLVNKQ
jgi:protein TonB